MNSIFLDQTSNWFWHKWGEGFSQKTFCEKTVRAAFYPFYILGALTFLSMETLRNRVFSAKREVTEKDLRAEFTSLTNRPAFAKTNSARTPNRYPDILPYEHTRVCLKDPEFYFNANWMLGKKAIATQGPLPTEINEFWTLIWETNPSLLVMLTNLHEGGIDKCANYWDQKSKDFQVQVAKTETLHHDGKAKIVKRTIEVKKGSETKTFSQLQLENWPDHGVVSPDLLAKLVQLADQEKSEKGPLLAHCSAGVGRTGTFLAAYHAYQTKNPRLFGIVDSMRYERIAMVQRPEQYILAHNAIQKLLHPST